MKNTNKDQTKTNKYLQGINFKKFDGYEKQLIRSSLMVFEVKEDFYDYSMFILPIMRVLEHTIELSIKNHTNVKVKSLVFKDFNKPKNSNKYALNTSETGKYVKFINKAYNYYRANRHENVHLNDLTPQKIMSKKVAQAIVRNTLNLLRTYSQF